MKRTSVVDQWLEEYNLTTNDKKRKVCVTRVKLYGLILTDKGYELDAAKIASVQAATETESKMAVKSFLGLTNYCARFIPKYATVTFCIHVQSQSDILNVLT